MACVGPLEEQLVLLTAELSLAPISSFCRFWDLNSGCEACGAPFPAGLSLSHLAGPRIAFLNLEKRVLDRAFLLG